ncbi:CRISPR-associated protein Csx19 [Streptomyces sp. TS71-3]|uniref:type III-D CRISPR-associated protein Csx19 n=1 Tax=Streptomyces sp. TS71-3 TaxID=2733862 RepID=UPI001B0FF3BE|nr:CRISPR-associated protein Csx19 [Streptomyces sp. TS71-3]GHJ35476.1 hypothetical protein Sm713_10850 [Streptomyces sp. TS71-3]
MTTVLHGRAADAVTLPDALVASGFTEAVAFLSAPHQHKVVHVHGGRCHAADGEVHTLDAVFEARAFDEDKELRWLCQTGTTGRAVLLTEDPAELPDAAAFPEQLTPLTAHTTMKAHYLLWGRPLRGTSTWTTLHTPQIGTLDVPFPYPTGAEGDDSADQQRLSLATREYVCVDSRHGNAYVGEERLLRIEAASHGGRK